MRSAIPFGTHNGLLYPLSMYIGWFTEVGYELIERIELAVSPPGSLIRPEDQPRNSVNIFLGTTT
jgi:hypothetical protein